MVARLAASVLLLMAVAAGARAASPFETKADQLTAELRRRAGKPEAIAPLGALVRLEEELPPGRLLPVLRELAEGKGTHPLVAAQAAFYLSLEDERRGEDAAAEARRRQLGFWNHLWVVGPFDAQGRSGLARAYPPEQSARGLDPRVPGQAFAGKERDVSWRLAPPEAFREGAIFVDGLLRPESDAVAYLLAVVESPSPREAVLRLGSPGPVKVWVNGVPAHQRSAVRPSMPDQDAVPARLRAGENWVLVKTVVTSGAWRLYLRFTDLAGRPLPGLAPAASPRGPAPALVASPTPPGRAAATDLGALLRRRAEGARAPGAWLDLARYLALVHPEDVESQPIEAALRKAGNASEALLLLSEVAREEDDRRAALEAVAARTGEPASRALALTRLGDLARQRRRDASATAAWRAALAAHRECWPATLALAFDEQNAGLASAALARLDALPAEVRRVARVARARARVLEALGRRLEASAVLAEINQVRRTDLDVAQELAGAARTRGDLARAAALYGEAARRRPDLPFMTFETARLLEGRGDLAGARSLLASAAARLPDDPRIPEEQGRLLARANQVKESLPFFQRALALRPQNPALRRYAERLAAESGQGADRAAAAEDLAKRFAADAEVLARAAFAGTPATDARAVEGSVVLLDRRVVRVHQNGLSEQFAQRVVEVRSERAARENQEYYVRYTPGSQEVEIRKARILRRSAGGEVEISEATARDDRDLSEPWYGLYYDNRAEVVSYEDLRAGDVIEVQYTVADVGLRNEMADYFGDFNFIGETASKKRWDYTLIGPEGRTFYFNAPRVAGLRKSVEKAGGEVVHRFSATDVPRVQPEPSMPGFAEAAPYLHVSTYKGWEDVGRWYWHLVEDQLTPDDTLRRAAAEATRGLKTDEEKTRALHRYVIEGTRYVGLEFGIHGYKPYRVTQVLARRFGDCKDKASLLLALLREVGIDSELVLVRTRRGGKVDTAPASLAVFDHAIVYVPRLSLYLDGTAEFAGMRELPSQDQGVMVLRVSPRGATLTETPVLPAAANRASRVWRVDLDVEGSGRIAEDLTITGQAAPEWRVHYQTPGERQERFSKVWNGRFPGAKVESLRFVGIEDRNHPVTLRAEVSVPRVAERRSGGELQLPITARDADFVRTYARLSGRRHELQLGYPWVHEEELIFRIPEGWHVVRQPGPRRDRNPFGRFELEVSPVENGRALRVRSLIEVERHRISPGEYGAFRKFLGVIDGVLGERIIVAKDEG
jgi:tetratricopeptide (TPR) repeat protein